VALGLSDPLDRPDPPRAVDRVDREAHVSASLPAAAVRRCTAARSSARIS
jgi:hypothetical protein